MIIIYPGYGLTFAIGDNGGVPHAAFLTSSQNMNDGNIGLVTSMRWSSGAQTTASYVEITCTITDPLDATAPIGGVMVSNVVGLPAGLKLSVNGVDQVLVENALGELQATWLPVMSASNTLVIRIKNDKGGTSPISAGAVFGIGEILIGRVISLPSLVAAGMSPSKGLTDPTAGARMDSGSLYQCMRKPWDTYQATLGLFTRKQAFGGSTSNLQAGSNPASVIDINKLRGILSKAAVCAVCDYPSAGGAAIAANGIRYDQNFMQGNWIIARPSDPGHITEDQSPYCTWRPVFAKTA